MAYLSEMKDGKKGLIIMACGPSFTNPGHFEEVKSLVEKYVSKIKTTGRTLIPKKKQQNV
jgi:hypothetical protein